MAALANSISSYAHVWYSLNATHTPATSIPSRYKLGDYFGLIFPEDVHISLVSRLNVDAVATVVLGTPPDGHRGARIASAEAPVTPLHLVPRLAR